MKGKKCTDERKKVIKLAALATPKASAYVVKKECAKEISYLAIRKDYAHSSK